MKKIVFLLIIFICGINYAQVDLSIGYNSTGLTTAELAAMPAALKTTGLIIKDKDLDILVTWDGAQFVPLSAGGGADGLGAARDVGPFTVVDADNATIDTGAITSTHILDGTIAGADIAATTITGAKIATATITGGKIANSTIQSGNIASFAVENTNIASGAVAADKMQDLAQYEVFSRMAAGSGPPSKQGLATVIAALYPDLDTDDSDDMTLSSTQNITGLKTFDGLRVDADQTGGQTFSMLTMRKTPSNSLNIAPFDPDFANIYVEPLGSLSVAWNDGDSDENWTLYTGLLTSSRAYNLPDASGEIMLTSTTGATDDQNASEVPFTPYSTIASTDVQAAIQELLDEGGGSANIEDDAFGAGWNGDTANGASQNTLYDYLITLVKNTISGRTGTAVDGIMIQTEAQIATDGDPDTDEIVFCSDCAPMELDDNTTVTADGYLGFDDRSSDTGTYTFSGLTEGSVVVIEMDRASAPSLSGITPSNSGWADDFVADTEQTFTLVVLPSGRGFIKLQTIE